MPTNKPSPLRVEAERLCREMPDAPSRTLAKRLAKEFKSTVENARGIVRNVRGQFGVRNRKINKRIIPKAAGKAGWKPADCPASLAEPWSPFVLNGARRVGILSDIHVPYHDSKALTAAVVDLRKRQPDCIVLNGDFGDFYAISRWQKDPRKRDFKAEHDAMRGCLEWIRGAFPKARMVFKKGNHEERWDHWLWNHAPEVCDLEFAMMEHWLDFEGLGIEMVEEQRPIMAGKLPILHGHEFGKSSIAAPVNPARGAFLRTMHSVLVGHSHRTSTHVEGDMFKSEVACWSAGCLCDLSPEYQRIGKANWGFAFVEVEGGGDFQVSNLRLNKNRKVRAA